MKKLFSKNAKILIGKMLIIALSVSAITACGDSKDDGGGGEPPAFPTFSNIDDAKVGQTYPISFNAAQVWTISSDKPGWCSLNTRTGGSGQQTVNITIGESGHGYLNDDVATITFAMGEEETSFTVTRKKKTIEATFYYDYNINEDWQKVVYDPAKDGPYKITPLTGGVFQRAVTVNANYDWSIPAADFPNWMSNTESISGKAGQDVVLWFYAREEENFENLTSADAVIKLKYDIDKNLGVEIPVSLAAFSDDFLRVNQKHPVNLFGLYNKTIYTSTTAGGGDIIINEYQSIDFEVQSAYEGYQFVTIIKEGGKYTGFGDWIEVTKDGTANHNDGRFTAVTYNAALKQNTGEYRSASLLAIPKGLASSANNLSSLVNSTSTEIANEFKGFEVFFIDQTSNKPFDYSSSILFTGRLTSKLYNAVEAGVVTTTEADEEYGTQNVYILELSAENTPVGILLQNLSPYIESDEITVTDHKPTLGSGSSQFPNWLKEVAIDEDTMSDKIQTSISVNSNTTGEKREQRMYYSYINGNQRVIYGVIIVIQNN